MTRGDSYTAVFQNDARFKPNGSADGILELTTPNGELLTFRVDAGFLRSTDGGRTVAVWLLLRAAGADSRADVALVVVRPSSEHQECLIYDLLGSQGSTHLHVEAEGEIVIIRR